LRTLHTFAIKGFSHLYLQSLKDILLKVAY
jgi:hypothetical protein